MSKSETVLSMKENLFPKENNVKAFIIKGGKFLTRGILKTTAHANVVLKRVDFGKSCE